MCRTLLSRAILVAVIVAGTCPQVTAQSEIDSLRAAAARAQKKVAQLQERSRELNRERAAIRTEVEMLQVLSKYFSHQALLPAVNRLLERDQNWQIRDGQLEVDLARTKKEYVLLRERYLQLARSMR